MPKIESGKYVELVFLFAVPPNATAEEFASLLQQTGASINIGVLPWLKGASCRMVAGEDETSRLTIIPH